MGDRYIGYNKCFSGRRSRCVGFECVKPPVTPNSLSTGRRERYMAFTGVSVNP